MFNHIKYLIDNSYHYTWLSFIKKFWKRDWNIFYRAFYFTFW